MCEYDRFCEYIAKWVEWFDSDNSRCIVVQVQHLLFDTFVFKSLEKAYELSETELIGGKEIKMQNQMLHWFIDKNYVKSVHMDIRRLVDRRADVVSLTSILDDMKGEYSLLTRKNYAKKLDCFEGLSVHEAKYLDEISSIATEYEPGEEISLQKASPFVTKYNKSERFHTRFDSLCGKTSQSRDLGDVISSEVFKKLTDDLERCKDLIKGPANKIFMHNDKKKFHADFFINYSDIFEANKKLSDVVKYIALNLLGDYSISMLPSPPTNWHKYFDRPILNKKHFSEIRELWQSYSKELNY